MPFVSVLAAANPYLPAAFGLVGSLIGGFIAIVVARHAQRATELAWFRDSRSEIYDRFLTSAQELLVACQACRRARAQGTETEANNEAVALSYRKLAEAHAVVQMLADPSVVQAARDLDYRTVELKRMLDGVSSIGLEYFGQVSKQVRVSRHDVIDAIRTELGAAGSARPSDTYNPFEGTPLEGKYVKSGSSSDESQGPPPQEPHLW